MSNDLAPAEQHDYLDEDFAPDERPVGPPLALATILGPKDYDPSDPRPGVYDGIDPDLYHASVGISSSGLQTCLCRSPAHYRWQRDNPERHDYLDEGNVAHTALLEPHLLRNRLHVVDAENWRTDKAKMERDETLANHPELYVLNRAQAEEVFAWCRSVERSARTFGITPDPFALLRSGHVELTFVSVDPVTGLKLGARPDVVSFDQRLIIDFKTDHDASPEAFRAHAHKLGYGMRAHAYIDTIARSLDDDPALWTFLWIVVEKKPPYVIAQYGATSEVLRHGALEYRKGLDLVASCEATGVWPAYSSTIEPLFPPDWVVRDMNRRVS